MVLLVRKYRRLSGEAIQELIDNLVELKKKQYKLSKSFQSKNKEKHKSTQSGEVEQLLGKFQKTHITRVKQQSFAADVRDKENVEAQASNIQLNTERVQGQQQGRVGTKKR